MSKTSVSLSLRIKELFNNRPLVHVLFWTSYIIFYGLLWGSYDDNYQRSFTCELAEMFIKLPLIYFVIYPLLNNYLFQRRYLPFFGWLFLAVVVAGIAQRALYYYVLYPPFFPDRVGMDFFNTFRIVKSVTNLNSMVVIFIAIKTLRKWYEDQQSHKELVREKLEAELKYLKSQVHPHFLFNTLNNLYSLTLKKSDKAPEVVLKLSDLMSYMLYDATASMVSLNKEIQYLRNYIMLEEIRYGKRLDLAFNITGEISGKMIAPMLLLPFVENSFKHGVSGDLDTVWTVIDLDVQQNKLVFKVENSKSSEPQALGVARHGIGLTNVRRRLDLLYQDRYDLKIFDEADTFLIVLKLELHDNEFFPMVGQTAQKEWMPS